MGLTPEQAHEAQTIAELEVRRYFDRYLTEVFPTQVAALIQAHDMDPKAHLGVERRLSKLIWVIFGAAGTGGGVGAIVTKLLGA